MRSFVEKAFYVGFQIAGRQMLKHIGFVKNVDTSLNRKTKIWFFLMKIGALYGCHQKLERSFSVGEYQFPVCARCTGIILSKPFAWLMYRKIHRPALYGLCLIAPMTIDGLSQYLGLQVSNNNRRFVTGFIGGFGISILKILILSFFVQLFNHKK